MNEALRPERNVELGASNEPFQNLHEFIRKARSNLNQNAWDYIAGAAETETTMRRNRMALDEIAFRPRVLRDVRKVSGSVEQFGRKMRLPVVLAPSVRWKSSIRMEPPVSHARLAPSAPHIC